MNINFKTTVCVIVLFTQTFVAFSQCKSNAKKCIPELFPYTLSDELNSVQMTEDVTSDLLLTFFSGQDYRVIVCTPAGLGNIEFKVKDVREHVVFNSKDHNYAQSWDFKVSATDDYFIELNLVNTSADAKKKLKGCVTVLVGFKM